MATAADVLAIARSGALVVVGGTALLVNAGERLLRRTAAAGEQQMNAWRKSLRRASEGLLGSEDGEQ